jgi:hypothetical protein
MVCQNECKPEYDKLWRCLRQFAADNIPRPFSATDFTQGLPDGAMETGKQFLEDLAKIGTLCSNGTLYWMPLKVLDAALEQENHKEDKGNELQIAYPCKWYFRCKKEAEIFSGQHGDWCICCWSVYCDPTSEEYTTLKLMHQR